MAVGAARRGQPGRWRLAAVWAVGSLVVVTTGLVLAVLLAPAPPAGSPEQLAPDSADGTGESPASP